VSITILAFLESGGVGDVFFLDGGVDDHFLLLNLLMEEIDEQPEKTFRIFLANPVAKMGQV